MVRRIRENYLTKQESEFMGFSKLFRKFAENGIRPDMNHALADVCEGLATYSRMRGY